MNQSLASFQFLVNFRIRKVYFCDVRLYSNAIYKANEYNYHKVHGLLNIHLQHKPISPLFSDEDILGRYIL